MELDNDIINHLLFHKALIDENNDMSRINQYREMAAKLIEHRPMLVWVDCDLFESAYTIFDNLKCMLPSGCVVYFDDLNFNFGDPQSGEARVVRMIQSGQLGAEFDLVQDMDLCRGSGRVFRWINRNDPYRLVWDMPITEYDVVNRSGNGSPFA